MQQILALDDGHESSLGADWPSSMTLEEAILVAQDRARGYREARDLLRKMAVSRSSSWPKQEPRAMHGVTRATMMGRTTMVVSVANSSLLSRCSPSPGPGSQRLAAQWSSGGGGGGGYGRRLITRQATFSCVRHALSSAASSTDCARLLPRRLSTSPPTAR